MKPTIGLRLAEAIRFIDRKLDMDELSLNDVEEKYWSYILGHNDEHPDPANAEDPIEPPPPPQPKSGPSKTPWKRSKPYLGN